MKTITIFYDEAIRQHVTLVCDDSTGELKAEHVHVGDVFQETPEKMWARAATMVGAANVKLHKVTAWEPPAEVVNDLPARFHGDGGQKR